MNRFAGSAVIVPTAFALAACASGHRIDTPPPATTPRAQQTAATHASSSRLILHRQIRCTATVTTPAQAGRALDVSFAFHNLSRRTVNVALGYGGYWLIVKSSDGTTYDTRVPLEHEFGPFIAPTPIKPGETETRTLSYLRVRWSGPLRITPGCGTSELPALRVAVTSPGLPASDRAAVAEVVAATGHLLDRCRPQRAGVPVVGRIDPPSGDAPPMRARCSIGLRRERGFLVAQVLIVTPPGLRGVHVREPYEGLVGPHTRSRNTEAIAWQFVVTRNGASSVYSAEIDTTRSGTRMAPDWTWTGSKWQGPGGSRCGGSGEGFGGIDGPDIEFVSVCSR
jgi:hypothetical protein